MSSSNVCIFLTLLWCCFDDFLPLSGTWIKVQNKSYMLITGSESVFLNQSLSYVHAMLAQPERNSSSPFSTDNVFHINRLKTNTPVLKWAWLKFKTYHLWTCNGAKCTGTFSHHTYTDIQQPANFNKDYLVQVDLVSPKQLSLMEAWTPSNTRKCRVVSRKSFEPCNLWYGASTYCYDLNMTSGQLMPSLCF